MIRKIARMRLRAAANVHAGARESRGATSLTDFMHMQAAELLAAAPEREKTKKMTRIFSFFSSAIESL